MFHELDSNPGPALPLSPTAAATQADELVHRLRAPARMARPMHWAVAGSVVAAGALALLFWSQHEQPRPVREAPARNTETAPAPVVPPSSPAREAPDVRPRDWLELANAARARRDFVRAEQLYLRVVSLYPSSDDAAPARLAAADLRAQQLGRARDALQLYRELIAMRPNGVLVEQARAGLARTYFALGERAEEKRAWLELLHAYPRSLFAQEARARLKGL